MARPSGVSEASAHDAVVGILDWLGWQVDDETLSVHHLSRRPNGDPVFAFKWEGAKYVEVDRESGQVVEILDLEQKSAENRRVSLQPSQAVEIALGFLRRFELLPRGVSAPELLLDQPSMGRRCWVVKWDHVPVIGDVPIRVMDEGLNVQVDSGSSKVLNYYRSFWSSPRPFSLEMPADLALARAMNLFEENIPEREIFSIHETLQFVRPNFYWDERDPIDREIRAAWVAVVTFHDNRKAEFWFDVETGACIGGDATRR